MTGQNGLDSNKEQAISESGQERAISVQNLHGLDAKIITMMEKSQSQKKTSSGSQRAYSCKVCRKEDHGYNIKHHIEANHLEGNAFSCDMCRNTFRSRKTTEDAQVFFALFSLIKLPDQEWYCVHTLR